MDQEVLQASIIIPCFERTDTLKLLLNALCLQTAASAEFEVIVIVDGGSPEVVAAANSISPPYALTVQSIPRHGETAARNRGLRMAKAQTVIYMDDDTVPRPDLVRQHLLTHARSARQRSSPDLVVMGAILQHEDSPERFLGSFSEWPLVRARCSDPSYQLGYQDFFGPNFSIRRDALLLIGGFDEEFRLHGGMDDTELGYRLQQAGFSFVYAKDAISDMYYCKPLARLLEDTRIIGRAQCYFYRLHPETLRELRVAKILKSPVRRPLFFLPKWLSESFFQRVLHVAKPVREWRPQRLLPLWSLVVRSLIGLFLGRGMWDEPATCKEMVAKLKAPAGGDV